MAIVVIILLSIVTIYSLLVLHLSGLEICLSAAILMHAIDINHTCIRPDGCGYCILRGSC